MYYIYTDHLNTPRAITDTANNLQWIWENKEAFGNNLPTEVVTGFNFNFRLPGQYFDSETNLNYNIHRDYNPVWGRYMSSDPLGLSAGINTYGYVGGNSLMGSDSLGLSAKDVELIRNLFNQNIKDMVKDGRRLAGRGDTNNNNEIVDRCNVNVNAMSLSFNNFLLEKTPFGTVCTEADKKLEYCEGQSTILHGVLNTNMKKYDDLWKFEMQSGPGHFWLVGVSSNEKDPILWMDSWKEEFSVGKRCKGCNGIAGSFFISPLPSKPIDIRGK